MRRLLTFSTLAFCLLVPVSAANAAVEFGTVGVGPIGDTPSNCVIPVAETTVTCTVFQRSAGSAPLAAGGLVAPSAGVVTSWTSQIGDFGTITSMTVTPRIITAGTAFPPTFTATRSGTTQTLDPADVDDSFTFNDRIPVAAGDRIGLNLTTNGTAGAGPYILGSAAGASYTSVSPSIADGTTYVPPVLAPTTSSHVFLSAKLETDADGDGFGDETQDGCAADPTTQGVCPEPPTISQITNTDGSLKFIAVTGGTVILTIERIKPGRKKKGKCNARAKTGKRCRIYRRIVRFETPIVAGANKINYGSKLGGKALKPGKYRATFVATNTANIRAITKFTFTVKKPRKKRRR